jgi:hypothetical protein
LESWNINKHKVLVMFEQINIVATKS